MKNKSKQWELVDRTSWFSVYNHTHPADKWKSSPVFFKLNTYQALQAKIDEMTAKWSDYMICRCVQARYETYYDATHDVYQYKLQMRWTCDDKETYQQWAQTGKYKHSDLKK